MNEPLLADTSLIINFFNGHLAARDVLQSKTIWISGITEIETLSSPRLLQKERIVIREFFSSIFIVDLMKQVKDIAIEIKVGHNLKNF